MVFSFIFERLHQIRVLTGSGRALRVVQV